MMTPRKIPHHVAIIPDGNRTWARERGFPTYKGHKKGFEQLLRILEKSRELQINTLTLWAFSHDNWKRTPREISYLMKLYEELINRHVPDAVKNETRIIHIGRKDRLPSSLVKKIINAEEKTKHLKKHNLVIALDYGGKDDMIRAFNGWRHQAGPKKDITEQALEAFLDTKELPYPTVDLLIRTGGQHRLSGYLLWQAAYAEIIFLDAKMPDFTPEIFEKCIKEFTKRDRTFGGDSTSRQ